jgi:hypothetical protein
MATRSASQCLTMSPRPSRVSQHRAPSKLQHQSYPHVKPNYGAKAQYTEDMGNSALLPKEDKKIIQEVISTFLYYARCIKSTMLAALGSIATQQANPTENTMKKVQQFLDYADTHPDAIVTYHASDMVLAGHSNTLYLSKTMARRRAGRHFFMPSNTAKTPNNGAILTVAQIIKAVMSSAAEAEVGALYINCREAITAHHTLEFMGHPQPPTPMQTNNITVLGVVSYQEIESNQHEIPLALGQRMSRTISTLLGPRQREQRRLHDKTSCHNLLPSNTPNFLHKYIYLTSTMPTTQPTTHRQSSCSKGVLDINYTTLWYNLHVYSKSHNESLF